MILDKEVKIFIKSKKTLNKYSSKGYDCELNKEILVKIKDLDYGSHVIINVKCDICGLKKTMKYGTYNIRTNNNQEKYFCNNKECVNEKRKININKKYGVDNVFQLNDIKEKIKKTNLKKYGVENPQQNKDIKKTTEETNLKIYGVVNVFQSDIIKEKIKKTNLKKYGVEYPQQNKDIRSKTKSYRKSKLEIKLYDFIKEHYDGEILTITKKIIGEELDIYLPELKLAFEFNGIYWHNEITKHKNYHKNKTDKCLKLDIQLIHVWEDDWNHKQEIIKSMILHKLKKTKNKIYARKTKIKEITDVKIVRDFLTENHIQGFVGSSIKIGLFYDNDLISLMCFKKEKNNNYDLCRFCTKINTNVIGGASKLFNYFTSNFTYNEIKTFADKSYSTGILYDVLGFIKVKEIPVDYCYTINNKKRIHKFNYRKCKLIKKGYDINKSEREIMLEQKIYRIYDSGKYKYIYKQ